MGLHRFFQNAHDAARTMRAKTTHRFLGLSLGEAADGFMTQAAVLTMRFFCVAYAAAVARRRPRVPVPALG
jgi:hypothetical protein